MRRAVLMSVVLGVWLIFGGAIARAGEATVTLDDPKHLPAAPGYHLIKATANIDGNSFPICTGIFLPYAYFNSRARLPMLVTLHNRQANGTDGGEGLDGEGLAMLVSKDNPDTRGTGDKPANPVNLRTQSQVVVLVPQCPPNYGWESPPIVKMLDGLIGAIAQAYRVDEDRCYLTGFSYGGSSTWQVALQVPRRFAAIVPIEGRATSDPANDVKKLAGVAIFQGIGDADNLGFIPEAERMRDALLAIKQPNYVYHVIHGGNHWGYGSIYTDPDFWTWLLAQHRPGATTWLGARPAVKIIAVTHVSSHSRPAGAAVLCQYYRDIPGNAIKDLTDDPAFGRYPDEQVYLDEMEIPANQPPDYGSVLRGLLRPPLTGDYTFYIASENQGELLLSSDAFPEHLASIASVTDWSFPRNWTQDEHQQSTPVHLLAGRVYFIEARQKNGGGDNHLSVAWKLPDGKLEGPIGVARLSPAPALDVPPPKITLLDPAQLPEKPGTYTLKFTVDYLGRQFTAPLLLILPHDYDAKTRSPALVFLADADQDADAAGMRVQGPAKLLSGDDALAAWSPLVVIAPQCPAGESGAQKWDKLIGQRITAAIVERMLHDLSIEPQKVYLSGTLSGATFSWKLATLLPGRFAVIAPFCTGQVSAPEMISALAGAKIHMITGCLDGMATDAANRIKDALNDLHPQPDVAYELKMGSEVADNYYARRDFYEYLLAWHRPPGPWPATR